MDKSRGKEKYENKIFNKLKRKKRWIKKGKDNGEDKSIDPETGLGIIEKRELDEEGKSVLIQQDNMKINNSRNGSKWWNIDKDYDKVVKALKRRKEKSDEN